MLRTADFNDGTMDAMKADQGNFSVSQAKMSVASATSSQTASAVFYHDAYLPIYYEVEATFNLEKPTGGWKANGYIIFDYYSPDDFKFAGINVSTNKIEMGYKDATGWNYVVQSNKPVQIRPGTNYNVLVAVNGTHVTLVVEGVNHFSHVHQPRIDSRGDPIPLNQGLTGVGMDGSKWTVDDFRTQILPPELTLNLTDDFAGLRELPQDDRTGTWSEAGGVLTGVASGGTRAVRLVDLGVGLSADSYLELDAVIATAARGGIVFDRYDDQNYKFVALDVAGDRVVVGHVSRGAETIDASWTRALEPTQSYKLQLVFKGAAVSVRVDGAVVGSHGFNSTLVDGDFGVMASGGSASYDDLRVATNDAAFLSAMKAAWVPDGLVTSPNEIPAPVTETQAESLLQAAIGDWERSGLVGEAEIAMLQHVELRVIDLAGDMLAISDGPTILIDAEAAGHGWFVDQTPDDGAEFADGSVARKGLMDLLTVLRHELGHFLGFEHGQLDVLSSELDPGTRLSLDGTSSASKSSTTSSVDESGAGTGVDGGLEPLVFDDRTGRLVSSREADRYFGLGKKNAA